MYTLLMTIGYMIVHITITAENNIITSLSCSSVVCVCVQVCMWRSLVPRPPQAFIACSIDTASDKSRLYVACIGVCLHASVCVCVHRCVSACTGVCLHACVYMCMEGESLHK